MRREEYLHILTEQIRCKMARGTIEQEINDHIEDQKAEFRQKQKKLRFEKWVIR